MLAPMFMTFMLVVPLISAHAVDIAVHFHIRPQALSSALVQFADQAGVQFTAAGTSLRGVKTLGVHGDYAPAMALSILLRRTGLAYRFIDRRTVAINRPGKVHQEQRRRRHKEGKSDSSGTFLLPRPASPVAPSEVANAVTSAESLGDSGNTLMQVIVTATRSPTAIDHIPGAVEVISGTILTAIQHSSLDPDQVLAQAIPGFSASNDDMNTAGELLRGARPEFLLDGVPMSTPLRDVGRMSAAMVDPALIQRIEVVDGASAIEGLNGSGGIINYITKTPTQTGVFNTVQTAFETQFRSNHIGWKTSDLTMLKRGNLDFLLFLGTQSRPMYYDGRGNLEYINPNGSYEDSKANVVTAKLGYDFGANHSQRIQLYFNDYDLTGNNNYNSLIPGDRALGIVQSAQRGPGPGPAATNQTSEATATYTNSDIAGGLLTAIAYHSHEYFLFPSGGVDPAKQDPRIAAIGTLIDASAVISAKDGVKVYWEKSDFLIRGFDLNLGYDYNSDQTAQNLVLTNRIWLPSLQFTANSGYVQMSFDRGPLTLSAGARYQAGRVSVPTFQTLYETAPATGGVTFIGGAKQYNTAVYNLGAVYRFLPAWSTFVGFSQGYKLPDIGLVIRNTKKPGQSMNTTAAVNPVVTDSYEAGVNWRGSSASVGADAYYAKSPSSTNVVTDPSTLLETVLRTPQVRKGIEFSADWIVVPRLTISGSYSHMLAYTSLAPGLPADANIPPGSTVGQEPDKAVLALEWNPLRAVSLNLTGSHYWGQNLNSGLSADWYFFASPYTVVDGGATYDMGAYGSVSLGVSNLMNTFHIVNETGTDNTTYYSIQGRKFTVTYQITF